MKKSLAIMLVFLMVFSFSNISYFASFAVADPTPTTKTLTGNKHFVEVTHYDVSGLTAEGDAAEWENNALNTISGTFSKKAKLGNDIWTKANNEDAFLKSTSSGSQKNAQVITGFIKPNQNIVELRVLVDDGIRWVIGENNITVVDSWEVQEAEYHSKSINLEKDKGYKFTIEYFDWGGQGALELEFKKANGRWQKFPQEWFYESGKNPKAVDDTKEMDEDTSIDIDVLDNDKNIDSLTEVSIKTDPAHGEVEVLANRKIKYTPDENYFGEDEFEYELSGGSSATVSITIYNKTDIPVARDDVANTDEDTPVDIYVLDNDGPDDISGLQMENEPISEMEIVSVTTPENGSAVIVSGEYITYTPNPDWNGTDEFYYTMSNGIGNTLDAKVTVTVNPVYDEPVANNDDVSIREDNDKNIKVLKNDEHIDEDVTDTVVEVISGPSHGTAIVLTNRKIKYEPTDDYYGSDEFEYELDGISSAIVSIMVYNKTDFPVARTDVAETDEDEPVDIDVLENDGPDDTVNVEMHDQLISEMEITSVTTPENGGAVIVNGEYITYTPNPDWNGIDEFDYTMSDGVGNTSQAKVTVTVNPVDDPPEAVDDSAKTHEETPVEIYVLDNDTDIDGEPMYVESFEQPEHGIVIRKSDDSNSEDYNVLIYTPDDDYYNRYHGETPKDRFTYMLNGGSDAIVKIKVLNIADQPIAVNDSAKTDEETPVAIEVLENDILPDVLAAEGHETPILEMHVESFTQPEHGIVERDSVDDDILVYTPDINYYNIPASEPRDEFTYTLNGGSIATVRVKVKNVADQPIANDDEAETDEDTMVYIDVLENDELPDMLTTEAYDEPILSMEILEIVSGPENGTAEIVKVGPVGAEVSTVYDHDYIEYTPDADWNGTDTFEYEITGGDTAIVTVTVIPVDDPPVAVNDWRQTDEETPKSIRVLNNDTDIDGGPMFVDDFTDPSHGTVHRDLIDENILIYTPDTDYYNNPASEPRDSFTYTLNGGSEATVKIKVNNIADQPIANDDEAETLQDKSVVIDVLANDELPDVQVANGYEELILSMEVTRIVTEPLHGTTDIIESVVPSDVTSEWQYNYIKYTPDPNWSGTDSFVYEVNGGSTANVEVVVYPQIMEYNHRSFYGAGAMQSSNDILLDNEFNELTLLAQMTAFNPETVGNLRNDIVEKPYNVNDLLNETFNLKTDSFTTYAETIEGEQPFESLNYVAIEGTILRNNSGNIIGYADNTIIDYNYNATNGVEPPEWHTIELDGVLNNPVVFAQLASVTGGQYTHVRVKDVNSNSFDVFLEEWDVHRATNHHYPELISYIVVEEGIHLLPDGSSIMEVIKTDDEASNDFAVHEFDTIFRERPVVLSQTQTFNDDNQVWMRQKAITDRSVELLKQTDSLNMSSDAYSPRPDPEYTHGEETIGIMAIEKINKYEVTFDANGGSPIPSTQLINEGKKATEPTDPSKSGYTFSHWKEIECDEEEYYYDEYVVETSLQDPFDFDTLISNDTCLLAVYDENEVTPRKTYSPNAVKDYLATDMNVPVKVKTSVLMSNDSHANNFVSVQRPSNGTVKLSGSTVTFTPDVDFAGSAKFYYTIEYKGKEDEGLVVVQVNAVIIEDETPLGASNRYIIGDEKGNFRSFSPLTRAELATMYARLLSLNYQAKTIPQYTDVISTSWYAPFINILKQTEILVGYADDTFNPDGLITRAELASSIARYYEFVGESFTPTPSGFTDIEGHPAQSDIEIVAAQEMMSAYTGTSFMPDRLITRVETIKVLNKLFGIQPRIPQKPSFNDINNKSFGFSDIEAATEDTIFTAK